jgi:hypothetical protein
MDRRATLISLVREGVCDAELAALVWLLVSAGVPVHVAAPDAGQASAVAATLRSLAPTPSTVSSGAGAALEEVLRQPVPLRPASGAVLILAEDRIVAAHLQRPPLRDAGGHVRSQGPAVLATWDAAEGGWEHFAWGVIPELADATRRRAGDFEIEHGRRREFLEQLVASPLAEPGELAQAMRGYGVGFGRS